MKRDSASAREAMTERPWRRSSRQSAGGSGSAASFCRLPAIDWIGASELFSSWPSTRISRCQACRSSSRSGPAHVGEHEEPVRRAALAERRCARISQRPAPPGKPASRICGAPVLEERRRARARPRAGPRSRGSGCPSRRSPKRLTSCRAPSLVEREDGDLDLRHDPGEQRRRLERAEALLAQRLGQRVDLDEHLAERVVRAAPRAPGSRSPPRASPRAGSRRSAAAGRRARAAPA